MTRKLKNILMIITAVILIITSAITVYVAGNVSKTSFDSPRMTDMQQMPEMNGNFEDNKSQMSENNSENMQQDNNSLQPGDNYEQQGNGMPAMPNENQLGSTPPELPSDMHGNNLTPQAPPEQTDNFSNNANDNNFDIPQFTPQENFDGNNVKNENMPSDVLSVNDNGANNMSFIFCMILLVVQNFALSAIIVYLILSKFNKLNFKESLHGAKRFVAFALSLIIITAGLTVADGAIINHVFSNVNTISQPQSVGEENPSTQASAASEVTDEQELSGDFNSSVKDESALLVKDGGNLMLSNAKITKTEDSSNTENSEFYGINSGILVTQNSSAIIKNTDILTSANGSNAVFSTGENSKIYISNSTIKTTGNSSARGLDATYGGYIEADNVTIITQGGSCAALATDRGEGTVIANNSSLETNGSGSPLIYSTGSISVKNITGSANASQIAVVEGKNSATVINSQLTSSGAGNRNGVDNCGIMIYQSMSGDAGEGTGSFSADSSTLTIKEESSYYKTAPMFFITNTSAVINLNNTKLNFGSGVLLSIKGTEEWGNNSSNGGNATLNAENQELTGNVVLDKISTFTMNLKKSDFSGSLNGDNSAASVDLTLDKDSHFTLTGDSYVTSFNDEDSSLSNIDFNGYTLYVNGRAVN